MKNIAAFLIAILLFISTKSTAQGTPQQLKDFDAYVEKAVADWQTPGLAIVVCKGNEVLFSKGYGVRELGKSDKVDTKTIFACASTTKAMTAAAMAMLVDEGKVRWQDKVVQHLPDFKVADVYLTNELTIRDLFSSRFIDVTVFCEPFDEAVKTLLLHKLFDDCILLPLSPTEPSFAKVFGFA